MTNPNQISQTVQQTHTVSVTVKIDGKNVTANPGGFISLSVFRELNRIPTATLVFLDGEVENGDFPKSNSNDFIPGKTVEILLGYSQQEQPIFKGIITRHSVRVLEGRPKVLELECKDAAVRTTLVRKSVYFYQKTDDAIFRDILQQYNALQIGALQTTPMQHAELVQYNCSDWDFMLMRAEANGMAVHAKDGSVEIKKPEVVTTPQRQIQFGQAGNGASLMEFEADIDVRSHFPAVKAFNWDYTQQGNARLAAETINATASSSDSGPGQNNFPGVLFGQEAIQLFHGGDLETQELRAWAEAKQKRGELSRVRGRVRGRVRVLGQEAHPGETLELIGTGERFNGRYLISGVVHQVHQGTWQTEIQFGWDDKFFAENQVATPPEASGLFAGIKGLQIGIVSKLAGDTEAGNHRIQVRIPYVAQNPGGSQSDGIWARLATFHAGSNRGAIFRPNVGDEVVIGFINDDPNDAVILGSLHSNNNAAPSALPANDANPKKGFVSENGLTLVFDDQAKTISLSNAGSHPKIEINAQSNTITIAVDGSNSIELSATGVTVKGTRIDLN